MKLLKIGLIALVGLTGFIYFQNSKIPSNLGVANGELAPVPQTPNAVSSQTEDMDKKVEPLKFQGDMETSKKLIKKAIKVFGGGKIIKEKNNYLHVVFTSNLLRFNDDTEFYFYEAKEIVHYRSAARAGYSDLGVNKERYDELRRIYYSQ